MTSKNAPWPTRKFERLESRTYLAAHILELSSNPAEAMTNTKDFNEAISTCAKDNACSTVLVPTGRFAVDPCILLKTNVNIEMDFDDDQSIGLEETVLKMSRQSEPNGVCEVPNAKWPDNTAKKIWPLFLASPTESEGMIHGVTISGGRIEGNYRIDAQPSDAESEYGVRLLKDVSDVTIASVGFANLLGDGILVAGASIVKIHDVSSNRNTRSGVSITDTTGDIGIVGGTFNANGLAGINVEPNGGAPMGAKKIFIKNVEASNNGEIKLIEFETGTQLGSGIAIHSPQSGIGQRGFENVELSGNTVVGNECLGITVSYAMAPRISGNTVIGNGNVTSCPNPNGNVAGIRIAESTNTELMGNVVVSNAKGIRTFAAQSTTLKTIT